MSGDLAQKEEDSHYQQMSIADALAAYADRERDLDPSSASPLLDHNETGEFDSLVALIDRLDNHMLPVHPRPAFVASLGAELVVAAHRHIAEQHARHRMAVIVTTVAAAALSAASLIAGILALVRWVRCRSQATEATTA